MRFLPALFALALIGCSGPAKTAQPPPPAPAPPAKAQFTVGKPGPVGGVEISNDTRGRLAPRAFSFGQIFPPGSVAAGETVDVVVDGQALPTQIDAKAFNDDGSVRHAVVTVELPELRGGQSLNATLVNKLKTESLPKSDYAPPPDVTVTLQLLDKTGLKRTLALDVPGIVKAAEREKPDTWLDGPLAQERRYAVDVDKRFQVIFDVFRPRSGPSRVDVIFCNDWNDIRTDDDVKYDVEISLAGKQVYAAQGVRQYPYSTWHRLVWSDDGAPLRAAPNINDLIAAGAVPRYDTKFNTSQARADVGEATHRLVSTPLNPGTVTTGMEGSGGRPDLGPLPTWAVVDLLDGDATTRRLLIANADAAGSVPWHIRERTTKLPLSADKYPDLWLDVRNESLAPLPQPYKEGNSGWSLDQAHQPSLTYLPYLVTGLRYYKDELAQQAAYVLLSYNPGYRGGAAVLIEGSNEAGWYEPVRGIAWSLRTVATAAYLTPRDDPMHAYFDAKLRGNLAYMTKKYVVDGKYREAGAVEGWVTSDDGVPTWQQGFLATTLGWINSMGYADAGRMLGWMSNFLAGLYTSEAEGFDPRYATSMGLFVRANGEKGPLISSWRQLAEVNKGSKADEETVRDSWEFYGLIMRAALGSAYGVKPSPRTKAAYDYVTRYIGPTAKGGDPTFAIVPP